MADHGSDAVMRRDINVATGGVEYVFSLEKHAKFTDGQRETLRVAANQSWADLRSAWISIHGSKAQAMLDAMSQDERDATRRTMRVAEAPP